MRVKYNDLSDKERMETLDALYTAAGTLKGRDAAKEFLKDLLTPSERLMLGRRILVARALLSQMTHDDIVGKYKVGKDTIQKISKWLDDQLPGYEKVIADMEKEMEKRQAGKDTVKDIHENPLGYLKKRYPMHFLLFPGSKAK